ncbi:DUF72 domain-containing protein [Luteimonas sp. SX5]|uniref:DUF72 domain-containing protein n=1 Tax=Luteimonas galliterrae TaxID=2940486 RepID=A0ABT0MM67_9GAMM|nr:DUF72 domain-containing protein [Luteimonas galliterrae]MCL1635698.1 DUF72 domain-containing protein [Luteimonas galliterrae]
MKTMPRIGCAGWSIPARHRPLFGAGDSVLACYATRFDAVEVNSSFYRPHQRKTYERWARSVPAHFRFSVKAPRTITHDLRLERTGAALDRFVEEIGGLGDKLGGVLVQLPPSLAFDARIAANFFGMLRRRSSARIACEPRHRSWFSDAAQALWRRYRIARVGADPALCDEAAVAAGTGTWRYWRWHGSPRMYYSAYEDAALRALAADVAAESMSGTEPWIIFDNTALGHAIGDALRLQSLFAGRARSGRSAERRR